MWVGEIFDGPVLFDVWTPKGGVMMKWPELPPVPAKYYTTTSHCSCLDFWFRGRYRACKHVQRLRQALALIEATDRKWEEATNAEA